MAENVDSETTWSFDTTNDTIDKLLGSIQGGIKYDDLPSDIRDLADRVMEQLFKGKRVILQGESKRVVVHPDRRIEIDQKPN